MKFFNSSKKWRFASSSITKYILAALLSLVGVQGVLAQYYVAGDGTTDNGWACGKNWKPSECAMSQSGNVYVYDSPELAAGTYLFKITNGTWDIIWGWSEVYSDRCTAIVADAGSDNNVKITLTESSEVKIIFNPNAAAGQKITVYAGITPLYIRGDVNSWGDPTDWQGVSTDGINYTWEGRLLPTGNEGKTNLGGEFKIATAVNGTWSWDDNFDFGGEESGTSIQISDTGTTTATLRAKTETGGNVNLSLSGNLQYPGAVYATMITFNISTKELVIYTEPEQSPITPTADSYVVEWAEPVYDSAAGTVTVSATVSTAENAGFTLADATFEAQVNVEGKASSSRTILNQDNNSISHTIQGVQAGSTVKYSLQIVTGGGSEIVLPSDVQNINPQAYTVPESVEPGTVSLYLIGSGTSAQWVLANALPFTYENGVYTWTGDLTVNNEAFKILTSNEKWEPAYVASSPAQEIALDVPIALNYRESTSSSVEDNKFKISEGGEYTIKVTLGADNSGSMIVTKKSDPAYSATITADASTAEQVSLASTLTETAAGTDLATATCVFQYKAADAGDETYADMSETASVIYSDEGATRIATLSQSMAAGDYVFRAVWTYSEAEVANAVTGTVAIGDAGVTYPVTPVTEHFSVEWTPVYNPADGTVTFTAQISATEDAGFVMGQITGLVAYIIVNGNSTQATVEYVAGSTENTATATVTYKNASINDVLEYSMSLTTGSNGIVSGVSGIEIAGGSYTVIEPEAQNSSLILRGEMNDWAYEGIDDKYVGKTYDGGTTVFWDWSESPVEFAFSSGDGSTFKIDDTTDGEWDEGQWGYKAGDDFWIVQDLISSDGTVTITGLENHANASSLLFDKAICPVTVSRMELNTATRTLTIDCEITVPQKDLWFRSGIVTPGWGNDITDPIGAGIDVKWQGLTSDGVVYNWDWSGANAVELSSGTEFKFGEYSGSNWAENGYAPNGVPQITLENMGTQIPVLQGGGNFSAGGDILVTGMTLDIEKLTLVVEGEAFRPLANAQVVVERSEIGSYSADAELSSLRVGDKVNITASFNEGYETGYSVSFSAVNCDMEDVEGNANAKTFTITAENPVITLTFMSSCQNLEEGFSISGQFNVGMDSPWVGTPINSGEDDPANGCFAGGDEGDTNLFDARKFTLTANSVPANYFEWECAGYALDGTSKDIPEITWANQFSQSATATVNLPGTYTFRLKAKCNESEEWINSAELTITAPVPQIGFDGEDDNIGGWKHAWAGQADGGLMTRQPGTLIWKSNAFTLGNLASEFVIIQRYKLGCIGSLDGWDGYNENGCDYHGNKINYAHLTLNGINGGTGGNFTASNTDAWVANETRLQLTVTMTGWDSYTVELAEYKNIIATATTEPADGSRGTVSMAAPDGTIIPSGSNVADYVGQQVTLTASPAQGYKVASWEINGKKTESNRTTITPTLSGDGLNVVVTFERDCYAGVAYDLTGGGVICAEGGKTELSLNTLKNVTYQLYKDGEKYDDPVQGKGEAAKWTISVEGTYTAKAYDSRYEECEEQAMDMKGSAVVTSVEAPAISVNPGANVHLTVLQARSFTAGVPADVPVDVPVNVPVDWSITDVTGSGDYCEGDGYMISSQTDTSLVAKFLCIGTAKITATMKFPNQNCKAEVTVYQNAAETEVCAPEPEDVQ